MLVKEIEVGKITIYQNIRSDKKDVSGLMKSIEQNGLQHPIGVYKKDNSYILAYGFRRLQAAKKLGWKTISAIIIQEKFSEEDFLTKNTIENIHREDINPLELGRVCHLFTERGFSNGEIAAKLHIPVPRVETTKYLYKKLPKEYKDAIGFVPRGIRNTGKISSNTAMAILHLNIGKEEIEQLLKYAKVHELKSRDIYMIEKLSRGGLTIKEVLATLGQYAVKNINLPVDKNIWEKIKYSGSFTNYVRDVFGGKEPINKDLFV